MFYAAFAVVGCYSIAHAQTVRGTDDQTAFAVPRIALGPTAEVALPQPLAPSDAARIRRIFALQARGAVAEASRETDLLDNRVLLGPILADRYLGGWMHPSLAELNDWLSRYADQPDAPAIRALRARLMPDGFAPPPRLPSRHATWAAPSAAWSLFVHNHDREAVAAATPLLSRPPGAPGSGEALLYGGLAAWRLGAIEPAFRFFEAAWRAAPTAALRAASAFWAGRTAQRQADRGVAIEWFRRAAETRGTFYGQIAANVLGPPPACLPQATLGVADLDALAAMPEGRLAFALLQVNEKRRAEAAFRLLWADHADAATLAGPLTLVAQAVGLPDLTAELRAASFTVPDGPMPPELHPAGGFLIDPALVYGLVRHESDFHAGAVSRSGARGLMQIKPATAWTVSGARALAGLQTARLAEPAVNLALGQRYLLQLAGDDVTDGDLIRVLASYAKGPFELRRWAAQVNAPGDPLLFLEAIPNPDIQSFVEDVLAWSWHYAALFHLPAPGLDALATGRFPRLVRAGADAPAGSAATGCGIVAPR